MGDPRNPLRADEKWDRTRLDVLEKETKEVAILGVLSGGWAWHFMSPPHEEYKLLHDHKDIDLFVNPNEFTDAVNNLNKMGYKKIWTQYDGVSKDFHRYEKYVGNVKVLIDLFIEEVPYVTIGDYIRVVEPKYLLTLYSIKHTTDDCIAVRAARELLRKNINPVGRKELINVNF